MKFLTLTQTTERDIIREATNILQRGGSVVYPTDTVYGLGVNPFDDYAVRRLFKIKKRSAAKPISLIIKNVGMAKKLAYIDEGKEKVLKEIWPGAVSVVFRKRSVVSQVITAGGGTVSLRVPSNEFCIKLIEAFDSPITSTSANISGEEPSNNPIEIFNYFKKDIYRPDIIIDAGILESRTASTVIDLTGDNAKVLRVGPSKPTDLLRLFKIR